MNEIKIKISIAYIRGMSDEQLQKLYAQARDLRDAKWAPDDVYRAWDAICMKFLKVSLERGL